MQGVLQINFDIRLVNTHETDKKQKMVQINLIKIPSFFGNFVKKTIKPSYDAFTGNIDLVKDVNCVVDEQPAQNTYQKILNYSKLPKVLSSDKGGDDDVDYYYDNSNDDDGIKMVEVEEKEFKDVLDEE